MEAVELHLPNSITVPKLVKSDGFADSVGVTVDEAHVGVSIIAGPSIDTRSSSLSQNGNVCTINASVPAFWNKTPDTEFHRHACQLLNVESGDLPKDLAFGSGNRSHLLMSIMEGKQLRRKFGKMARGSSGSSKRPRVGQIEVSLNAPVNHHIDDVSSELASGFAKCNASEKTKLAKQKSNLNVKRRNKRNGKVPKIKYDNFWPKNGFVSFSSAAGGNNNLDIFDVTKHLDELSLNELLDGSYKCPTFTRDKVEKAANLNQTITHSVRNACLVLRLEKSVQLGSVSKIDNVYSQKVSTCPVSSASCLDGKDTGNRGGSYTMDLSLYDKVQDSSGKLKAPADVLDFPLHEPKDILKHLVLPPSKDLDSLLVDLAKPAISSKNNSDLRLSKLGSRGAWLPPFPWSQASGGHFKSSSDAVKLSASRSTCPGRWAKVRNTCPFPGSTSGLLVDLESLTYDHNLVPSGGLKYRLSENMNMPSSSRSFTTWEHHLSSSATGSGSQASPAGHSPRLLAAAQTLYWIATCSLKQNPCGMIRWQKKHSQRTTKACKSKLGKKSEKIFSAAKAAIRPDKLVKFANETSPLKKLKLSEIEKSNDFGHVNTVRKGLIDWSVPQSSRSSPSKSVAET